MLLTMDVANVAAFENGLPARAARIASAGDVSGIESAACAAEQGGENTDEAQFFPMADNGQRKPVIAFAARSDPEFLERAEACHLPVGPQAVRNMASSVKRAFGRPLGMVGCARQTTKKRLPQFT